MDVEFNEACADAFGYATYRYCLMQKGSKFQWRWMPPYPPETNGDPSISPCFDNQLSAIEWMKNKTTTNRDNLYWKSVKP